MTQKVHGGPFATKKGGNIRMLLHNVRGVGFVSNQRSRETLKMERLKRLTLKHKFDLLCIVQLNKDWGVLQEDNTIWTGTKG